MHPHALRHSFASNVLDAGGSIDEVQELLGHASISSSQVYLHPAPQRLRAAVERVGPSHHVTRYVPGERGASPCVGHVRTRDRLEAEQAKDIWEMSSSATPAGCTSPRSASPGSRGRERWAIHDLLHRRGETRHHGAEAHVAALAELSESLHSPSKRPRPDHRRTGPPRHRGVPATARLPRACEQDQRAYPVHELPESPSRAAPDAAPRPGPGR